MLNLDQTAAEIATDLRALARGELAEVSQSLQEEIIAVCEKNGGHIGASLGTVDLTVTLFRNIDFSDTKMIWDIGHQAYAHKLLTGRRALLQTLRTKNGAAPFLSRRENAADIFNAGHSSTSISAAIGFALANPDQKIIAIFGDGSLTAGLAFEALNFLCAVRDRLKNLTLILNDNGYSIDKNVGAIAELLRDEKKTRVFFETFGLNVFAGMDGHAIEALDIFFKENLEKAGPKLFHVRTIKGRGYLPEIVSVSGAKTAHHAISPPALAGDKTFSALLGEWLVGAMHKDPHLIAITPAMIDGSGLRTASEKFPDRVFDVGIAEAQAVTLASAMALAGKTVIACIYSTFLQRAVDSLLHDLNGNQAAVKLVIDRAGLVGADGPTHHGAYDLVINSWLANGELFLPLDRADLLAQLPELLAAKTSAAIRFPRGRAGIENFGPVLAGKNRWLTSRGQKEIKDFSAVTGDLLLINIGCPHLAEKAWLSPLMKKIPALSVIELVHLDFRYDFKSEALQKFKRVLICENGIRRGGVGEALLSEAVQRGGGSFSGIELRAIESLPAHASGDEQFAELKLDQINVEKFFAPS